MISTAMMNRNLARVFATCLVLVATSCDSPKDANKANFTKALNEHLSHDCQMVVAGLENTPFP